ncbi:RNA methyltransferase [bacterium SCSIO 12741]|nr:RNA methyltransferase [bacterium SCSIO 12741]
MHENWNSTKKEALWDFLQQYLTDERRELFEQILEYRTDHFAVCVEDVYHEHNAGALVRTAECFGIQKLFVMQDINDFNVQKGMSKGAEHWLDIEYYRRKGRSTYDCMDRVRELGYQVVATTPHSNDVDLREFDFTQKSAFFFGKEKAGLSPEIVEQADVCLRIPIYGVTESYNISVSAALILYELTQKLHNSNLDWRLSADEQREKRLNWALHSITRSDVFVREFERLYKRA